MTPDHFADVKFQIGHVLFLDIVGHSKLLITEQSERLETLKEIVRATEQFRLADAEGKLLRLPTGDGVALVFRTSPEAPVLCALEISKALQSHPELQVRMGIHSGPVNEITDLNEQANIAGAGINIAQRMMDCGDAGHILLSKRVADDLEQYPRWRPYLHLTLLGSSLKRKLRIATKFAFALLLSGLFGCAHLATVKKRPARLPAELPGEKPLESAREHLTTAKHEQPLPSLGQDFLAAKIAYAILERRPKDSQARDIYNFAVARAVDNVQQAKLEPWRRPITVPTEQGNFILTSPKPADSEHDPSRYDLIPAETLAVGGKFLKTRSTVAGIGAPLVAAGRTENPRSRQRYALHRIYAPITALLEFRGRRVDLELLDPFETESVAIGKYHAPLAADFTAPIALGVTREHPEKLGFTRLLHPEQSTDTGCLVRLQPYDSKRTPVILVHGLGDSPVTWAPMVNALQNDSQIRRRYQFWVYSYPSGYPYPYSAALFRQELDAVSRTFPDHKGVVLIGHSMGGLVSRLLVTDAGDKIWRYYFGKPPAKTILPSESRKVLEESLVFNHRPEIRRVIFISTPHRGSTLASNWIGRLGTKLVNIQQLGAALPPSIFSKIMVADPGAAELKHVPTSVDTLEPNDRFVREMNKFPIVSSVPFHTIEGDRGRGNAPNSSDGVVPFWSSHLDGAKSELIVPSDHRAQRNPKAIAEVCRILKLHRE